MGLTSCVISLATNDKRYPQGLRRLERSLEEVGFEGRFLSWPPGSFPAGCPPHLDVPFAFKPYCFQEARRRGMQLVLWLDVRCVVIRPLDAIFEAMERRGYVLFRHRAHALGQWASDLALETLGLTREQALTLPEVPTAAVGLNLASDIGNEFLDRWHEAARKGLAFRGVPEPLRNTRDYLEVKWNKAGRVSADPRVRGHRHDQTVAGILAHQLGMELTVEGLQKYRPEQEVIEPGASILHVKDISIGRFDAIRARLRDRVRKALSK